MPLSDDDFIVTAMTHPSGMNVTRVRSGWEENIVSTPPLFPYDLSPSVFTTEQGWWFSREGGEGLGSSIFFVRSEDTIELARVNVRRHARMAWLPVRGDEPRGVMISIPDEPSALHVSEITPSGAKRIALFPWPESPASRRSLMDSRWSAEGISGNRIAVVSTDGPEGVLGLKLRIVGGGMEPIESDLPCPVIIDHPLDTAVDGSGRLAIVGLSREQTVVAMIVDPDQPHSARCRVISGPEEVAARPPFGTPSVVWTGERFVAGWIRDDGTVRAAELGELGAHPLIINVGADAAVDHPLRELVHADGEYVRFIWRERSGGFVERSLPKRLSAHALATDLWHLLCAAYGA